MIRETLAANSRYALADCGAERRNRVPLANQHRRVNSTASVGQRRAAKMGAADAHQQQLPGLLFARRLHLDPDRLNRVLSNMAVSAYAGLAVCAHNNAVLNTSVFDNVSASFLPVITAPALAPIASQTVNVGQTVAFTASATDTNSPPRT